jgi:hypothetical protein
MTAGVGGRIAEDVGVASRLICEPISTRPVLSAARVTSFGLILPRVDK